MVAYTEKEIKVTGVVCPRCIEQLSGYSIITEGPDRYGRYIREYFGWCIHCDTGFEVVQFKKDGRWPIHKYRYYAAKAGCKKIPPSEWTILNELPEPPAVVTGPGGDYDKAIELTKINIEILTAASKVSKAVADAFGEFVDVIKKYIKTDEK